MVGIKEIANKAQVSISTVSYALNGSPRVSETTRQRILAIANEMNYIPNRAGQSLRKKETNIIGVHLSSYSGNFYGDLLDGMHNMAKQFGFDIIACSGERSRLFLPQGMIDGIIVMDKDYPDDELIKYANLGHSIVVLDRKIEHPNIRHVLVNNKEGSKQAIQSLKDSPCKEVYIITGPKDNFDSQERLEAATQEVLKIGKTFKIFQGDFTEPSGYKAAVEISKEIKDPVVIFALNDEMGIGAFNYFSQSKYILGKNVNIIGFDDIEISRYLVPRLNSVSYSKTEWGTVSVNTLYKMLKGDEVGDTLIPTKFSK